MNARILCNTKQNDTFSNTIEEMELFSGKAAAVCYMKDDYNTISNEDNSKSLNRFNRVIETGHHSIADHCFITVLFENIPKITAMILNSVGFYNTSEKSGRYTVMNSNTQSGSKNEELYNKWRDKFITLIKEYDPTIPDKLREKLALENARYMLSIFAPNTTMVYTTSLRMWSYLVNWCERYIETADTHTMFNVELQFYVKELLDTIKSIGCYSDKIVDNKNKQLYFLADQIHFNVKYAEENFSDSYLIKYRASFADLAQEQRHRTLQYYMCFDGEHQKFYTPKLLKHMDDIARSKAERSNLEVEWQLDLESIKETFPIATLVDIVETGFIQDFLTKCDERLCGRTQLETMNTVYNNLEKLYRNNNSIFSSELFSRYVRNSEVVFKCGRVKCKEPCHWGGWKARYKCI